MIEHRKTSVTYRGDGVTTSFPFLFDISSADTIRVAIYDTATEITTEITRDYFVDVSAKVVHYPGYAPGQAPAAAAQPPKLPNGKTITIYRKTPINQLTNLGTKYPLPSIEAMSDKATAILQEHDEMLGRTVTLPAGDPKTPEQRLTDLQTYVSDAKKSAGAAAQSANQANSSQNAASSSATAATQAAAASERSRQASATIESHIKSLLNEVAVTKEHIDWSRGHIDNQKNAVDNSVTQAKVAEQKASNKADEAQKSSAEAAEAARRAENAQRYVGIVRGDNLADKVVEKRHLSFEVYDKSEVYAKSHIDQHFRKIGDKHVDVNVDWNTLTEPMTYKIQGATMNDAHHAPPNEYNFGLLVVHRLEKGKDDESRTVQIYYPQATRGYWSRMFNANTWTEWRYIPTCNELETVVKQNLSTRVSKSGDTMTGALSFANNIGDVLRGTMGDDDGWRVFAGSEGYNNGYLEIATCDDGTEAIIIRQYADQEFKHLVREAKLLDEQGNTSFPGRVSAAGGFAGTADSANSVSTAVVNHFYRHIGGYETPTITALIDWQLMATENNGVDARNIRNAESDVIACGGDNTSKSGYGKSCILMKQVYTDFDKLLVLGCDDVGSFCTRQVFDKWELDLMFANSLSFNIINDQDISWRIFGGKKGTYAGELSAGKVWRTHSQNCGIVEIYGIKY
jgi:hypothetical protein